MYTVHDLSDLLWAVGWGGPNSKNNLWLSPLLEFSCSCIYYTWRSCEFWPLDQIMPFNSPYWRKYL